MKSYANRVIFALCAALCALLVAALAACPEDEKPETSVPGPTNPFIRDRFTADPAAFIDYDGTVYIVCGEDTLPPDASPTEYYRIKQWLIYSTRDMKTFKFENVLMKSDDFTYGQENSAWASQAILGLDGLYYFYGTVRTSGGQAICVARATDPTGPYKQMPTNSTTPLVTSAMASADTGGNAENIDPTVFIDDDGTAWLSWSQVAPRIVKLKRNMVEIERPIKLLFPTTGWTSEHKYTEGPFLYKRKNDNGENVYYMIYASMVVKNGSDFAETISYSMAKEDPDHPGLEYLIGKSGVWSDGVPITDFAPKLGGGNSFTIHPAVLDFQGQTYLFYHNAMLEGVKQPDGSEWDGADARRSLCVDYMYFNADGTIKLFDNPNPADPLSPAKVAVDVRNPAGLSVPPKK